MPSMTMRMTGKPIHSIMKSNERLMIRAENGDELHVAWVDENGKPVKGRPIIVWYGRRVLAKTAHLGVHPQKFNSG